MFTEKKVVAKINLDLDGIPKDKENEAKQDVLDYVMTAMLEDFSKAKSPVTGEKFEPLSAKYKEYKKGVTGSTKPDMELSGDMLDALDGKLGKSDTIEIGWWDKKQAAKAFNHTTGDTLPTRPLLPDEGETFRSVITKEIESILDGYRTEESEPSDFDIFTESSGSPSQSRPSLSEVNITDEMIEITPNKKKQSVTISLLDIFK